MKSSNMEDLIEWLWEHNLSVGMGVLGITMLGFLTVGGSGDRIAQKFDRDAKDSDLAAMQARAEQMFSDQGCSAQFMSASDKTTGLTEGEIALDPATGQPFNGGLLCSSDGSLWEVQQGGKVHLIGSSPKIRQFVIDKGFAHAAKEMQPKEQPSAVVTPTHVKKKVK